MSVNTNGIDVADITGQHVFLVDDEPDVRQAIGRTLEQTGVTIEHFADGATCLELLPSKKCDLLITDLKMPEMDGIELLRRARVVVPWLPVLIMTGYGDIPTAVEAIKAGAADFVEKPLDKKDFVGKVQAMLDKRGTPSAMLRIKSLTHSESRVIKLVIAGKSNNEIANSLNRSKRTIETHRARAMQKLGVDNVIDLVKLMAVMAPANLPARTEVDEITSDSESA